MLIEAQKLLDCLPSYARTLGKLTELAHVDVPGLSAEARASIALTAAMRDLADTGPDVALPGMAGRCPAATVKLLGYCDAHSRRIIAGWLALNPYCVRSLCSSLGLFGMNNQSRVNALFRLAHQSAI